ncbi:hypothetical protein F0562_027272 [Nyssa sinensis]|uniref:BRI1 kinase inhibitor 1 n=1 Tax=Nyssa sinensis TaxID=561372 RepID=A0A5J5B527_9ASTE|nr:hypothetical protein F0562_027272 [Nyssa sinensis]
MDTQKHQKMRDKVENHNQREGKFSQESKQAQHTNPPPPPPPPPPIASLPSASSSPSHEFSFTISLHSPATTVPNKAKTTPPSIAIDLSPADDIFFHGHLLPLHLLSHLPVSPRSSTNSLDSFTLPITELLEEQNPITNNNNNSETKGRTKSGSFSKLFGLSKWKKECEATEKRAKEKHKKKLRIDLSHILKRKELRGRKGELSAPASIRTSPTNSGLLLATGAIPTSTSDSTMEELQAAIQAAIAHCKNSIAMEEKIKC